MLSPFLQNTQKNCQQLLPFSLALEVLNMYIKILFILFFSQLLGGCAHKVIPSEISTSHVEFDSLRTQEEMEKSVELAARGLEVIFNRARRKSPFLEGFVVFEVMIDTSGNASDCKIVDSTVESEKLETKLKEFFCKINFGKKRPDLILPKEKQFIINLGH